MTTSSAGMPVPRRPLTWSWSQLPRQLWRAVSRHPEALTAFLCALDLGFGERGPDLPAQVYRVMLFKHHGFVAFDSHWYAGHPLPGYSLIFPPLASVVGARLLGALSCIASTALFTRLLRGRSSTGHAIAVVWFAAVCVVDLTVGRLPFALGLAFGLAALVALRGGRSWWWTAAFAAACACASPLSGAFLLLAGAALLPDMGWRRVAPLGSTLVGIGAAALFGEGGWFPFPASTLFVLLLVCVGGLVALPRSSRLLRRGLLLYALASVVLFTFPNPIGGNMARLGAVFAGPLLADELWRARRRVLLYLASVPLLVWQFAPLPAAIAAGPGNPSSHASYYRGLLHYLSMHGAATSRLEVPLTDARWESAYLAPRVSLARGWERQVDLGRNSVLYDKALTAAAYHQWLLDNGVRWVALPDVKLDETETGEHALLSGVTPSYLHLVWTDAHWKLWEVRDARPLLSGPAKLVRLGVSRIRLQGYDAGTVEVLVRWTRFWRVTAGEACVAPTTDGWTQVLLPGPGAVTLTANVGLGALAGAGGNGSCSPGTPDLLPTPP